MKHIIFPDIYCDGRPVKFSTNTIKELGEYGDIVIPDEKIQKLEDIALSYLNMKILNIQKGEFGDLKQHCKKISKLTSQLLELIDDKKISSPKSHLFEYMSWNTIKIEDIDSALNQVITISDIVIAEKGKRQPNYAFNGFINLLKDFYLECGGNEQELPVGVSRLVDNPKSDERLYDSLFVDFVSELMSKLVIKQEEIKEISKKIYPPEKQDLLSEWFQPIKIYKNKQSLAKSIQRALADKESVIFYKNLSV